MEGARRAAALTQRLLAFSRQQALEPENDEPKPAGSSHGGYAPSHARRTGHHRIRLAPDAGRICADPVELENALLNLAVNARDAVPDGGTITIGTGER